MVSALDIVHAAVRDALPGKLRGPLVVGLCGSQGSGKSTLVKALATRLQADGLRVATLSLDDLYLTRAERLLLGAEVHPLLATRGVPGTHDLHLGQAIFEALDRGEAIPLPLFDKALDDRAPVERWSTAPAAAQILLFEGWCVGAQAEEDRALAAPVNALERDEDPDGVWRRHVNAALATGYQAFFARIDMQILLAAPGFEVVQAWRTQQEHELRARNPSGAPGILSDAGVLRFIQHYERLTRHMLHEMPLRADLTIALDASRTPIGVTQRRL